MLSLLLESCSNEETRVHVPVLLHEMLEALRPTSHGVYLDGTLGAGGYAEAILDASQPDGQVVGLDLDSRAVDRARVRLAGYGDRFRAIHGGFHEARNILQSVGITALDGAVLDLGLSSDQLDDPERGFSFMRPGALDMRFDTESGQSLAEYLGSISQKKLEETLATYGEERYCRKLARGILDARGRGELESTQDLTDLISRLLGGRRGRIHPATRTFQALRIAVNREMENLAAALQDIPWLLKRGARFCVVAYHSLEDRAVKLAFNERKKDPERWVVVTRHPIRPTSEETRRNPRARSARMRVLMAVGDGETRFDESGMPE